jgi:hypothetical protein
MPISLQRVSNSMNSLSNLFFIDKTSKGKNDLSKFHGSTFKKFEKKYEEYDTLDTLNNKKSKSKYEIL